MNEATRIMVDGHVHIYDCYQLETFFDNALKNLGFFQAACFPGESTGVKVLLLTEGKSVDYFSRFQGELGFPNHAGYYFKATEEDCSLALYRNDALVCYLLRGRQIVTAENVEVLALATHLMIADGLPVEIVLEEILAAQQVAVLPWGFGKWLGHRGKIISRIIDNFRSTHLFLGDNSGRPGFLGEPVQFRQASSVQMRILNGSDPLPFDTEMAKPGSYGFALWGPIDEAHPAQSFREILVKRMSPVISFGNRDNALSFIQRQSRMHFKKHLGK